MKPYYDHGGITIYHGDQHEVLPTLASDAADLALTDPPYSPAFHDGARTANASDKLVTFEHIEIADLRAAIVEMHRVAARWVVSFMDWRHASALESEPPRGGRFVRLGIWVKPDSAPQFTGDRPSPGWEAIVFMHRAEVKLAWGGHGRSSVFTSNTVKGSTHPTEKPLRLVRELVRLCSEPGSLVLDPFMGSGTTLRAAKDEGRRAIGIEKDERYCELAAARLGQEILFS